MQSTDKKIEIRTISTKKQIKEFIEFPLKLYKNCPYFVPPLYGDEKSLFDEKKNIYSDQSESAFFGAYINGKMVGRIHAILQKASNIKWKQKRVRFTRFDAINDQAVADALFDAVTDWAKKKGMDELVGPLGYSDLDREGLLIEGFDQLSTFEEQYNYEYYKTLIENYGFEKEVDWVERQLRAPEKIDERIPAICDMMMKKYNLHFGVAKNTDEFLKKYADSFFDILDKTYDDLYMTVPFTAAMKKMTIDNFRLIIDIRFVYVILDENEKVVCFGLCMPSISKAVQKSGGRLTPLTILKLLKAIKKPRVVDLALIGVLPEYARRGISTVLIWNVMKALKSGEIDYAETNLNLEDNLAIQNQWKKFDSVLHKRRRSFVKKI